MTEEKAGSTIGSRTDKAKFPHGPQWLTGYIKSKGLHAGLWLVPNVHAGSLTQHPEWYLRTVEGDHIPDYATPVLDSSNPGVLGFLRELFSTLNEWGFEYYKFDGEGSIPQAFPELDRKSSTTNHRTRWLSIATG